MCYLDCNFLRVATQGFHFDATAERWKRSKPALGTLKHFYGADVVLALKVVVGNADLQYATV